jgi:hypothetical protein
MKPKHRKLNNLLKPDRAGVGSGSHGDSRACPLFPATYSLPGPVFAVTAAPPLVWPPAQMTMGVGDRWENWDTL